MSASTSGRVHVSLSECSVIHMCSCKQHGEGSEMTRPTLWSTGYNYRDRLQKLLTRFHVSFFPLHSAAPSFSPPSNVFFFPFSHTKGRARCWCFITLTEAEWCYIIKSLLKGRGLSIITAAAFMFSLASASLRCHRWPFVPYQRRLWSSGSSVPDTYDTD